MDEWMAAEFECSSSSSSSSQAAWMVAPAVLHQDLSLRKSATSKTGISRSNLISIVFLATHILAFILPRLSFCLYFFFLVANS